MTGFESYVANGLKGGVAFMGKLARTVDAAGELSHGDLVRLVAAEILKLWPSHKVSNTVQADLPLDPPELGPIAVAPRAPVVDPFPAPDPPPPDPEGGQPVDPRDLPKEMVCARCEIVTHGARSTPYGFLCGRCMTAYIDRKWPVAPGKTPSLDTLG